MSLESLRFDLEADIVMGAMISASWNRLSASSAFTRRIASTRVELARVVRNDQVWFDVVVPGYMQRDAGGVEIPMRILAGCRQEAIDMGYLLFGVSHAMRRQVKATAIEVRS